MRYELPLSLRKALTVALSLFALLAITTPARASLTTDLEQLESEALAVHDTVAAIDGVAAATCGPLVTANQMARDVANHATAIDESLAAPLTVDASVLEALERLAVVSAGLAVETSRLATDMSAQQSAVDGLTIKNGIVAMLQLSDDIGTMADRIGVMADKILVMADNIGSMADRILETQEIWSQNLLLTESMLLETQTNALSVVSVVEQSSYDLQLLDLIDQGNALASDLASGSLSSWNMAKVLSAAATDVRDLRVQVETLRAVIVDDTASNTISLGSTSLTNLVDLSLMLSSLQTAVDGYAVAISGLQAITSTPTLLSSMSSMLQLSADIGVMANRILEMANVILAMADNIGAQADQIVLTQRAVSDYIASTQARVLAIQELSVSLIALRS